MSDAYQAVGMYVKKPKAVDEHGRFLAWKLVRSDYRDIYTGNVSNHVGAVIEMDRTQVDDDPNRTCSAGLHICTWHYLPSFGSAHSEDDRVMIVAVDPKDGVAVPTDYDNAKMRVCRYVIVGEVSKEDAAHAFEGLSFVNSDKFVDEDNGEDDF